MRQPIVLNYKVALCRPLKSLTFACRRWYLRKSKHSWRQCWDLFWNHRSHKWDYRILRRKIWAGILLLITIPFRKNNRAWSCSWFFFFLWILSSKYMWVFSNLVNTSSSISSCYYVYVIIASLVLKIILQMKSFPVSVHSGRSVQWACAAFPDRVHTKRSAVKRLPQWTLFW